MKTINALAIATSAALLCGVGLMSLARSDDEATVARAEFNRDGQVNLPVGYRNWTHVGTRIKSIGINILDDLPTKGPELLSAYVEPSAMAVFERSGQWPDGTQIVKEFSSLKTGEGCDTTTAYCKGRFGEGIFETGYVGLGMMVKDAKRFPDSNGNWGYFTFGHKSPPYDRTAMASDKQKCEACHINLASDTDYVISRAHIGLIGKIEENDKERSK
jgi:Cytochrome P460